MSGSGKSKRGFASMDASRQREIASKGGKAAHAKGTAHEWTSDEARVAGRKGGEVVSRDREHMAAIGREGGESRGSRKKGRESRQGMVSPYSDRESRVEVTRETANTGVGFSERGARDESLSEGIENVRDEDVAVEERGRG